MINCLKVNKESLVVKYLLDSFEFAVKSSNCKYGTTLNKYHSTSRANGKTSECNILSNNERTQRFIHATTQLLTRILVEIDCHGNQYTSTCSTNQRETTLRKRETWL